MLHFAVVKVSALFLLKQVLQAFELVDVERLKSNEFFSSDERHLLCRVHSSMSAKTKTDKYTHKKGAMLQLCKKSTYI